MRPHFYRSKCPRGVGRFTVGRLTCARVTGRNYNGMDNARVKGCERIGDAHCRIALERDKFFDARFAIVVSGIRRDTTGASRRIPFKETLEFSWQGWLPRRCFLVGHSHAGFLLRVSLLFQLPSLLPVTAASVRLWRLKRASDRQSFLRPLKVR